MADCTYTLDSLSLTGDDQYPARICDQPFVDYAWENHGFNYDYWQDGWGWDDCCNVTKPLGRAFASLWLLNYCAEDPQNESYDAPMLNWACRYVREQFQWCDDLRADCGSGSIATTTGCQWTRSFSEYKCTDYREETLKSCDDWHWLFSWLCIAWAYITTGACYLFGWVTTGFCSLYYGTVGGSQNITLHLIYFYTQGQPIVRDVVVRAGTLVHEARHLGDHPHNADFPPGSQLGSGEGADSSWDAEGAWMYHALFLWWFFAQGQNTTPAMRNSAKTMGNFIIANAFASNPGFVIS